MASRLLRLIVIASAIGVLPAAAQDLVSPFHGGEWGAHIAVNGLTFSDVDVLRFTAPTRAWVLSIGAAATAQQITEQGFPSFTSVRGTTLSLSVQRRFFRTVAPHATIYLSPGISGGGSHQCGTPGPGTPEVCNSQWQFGILAELGGEYLMGPHVGLGVRYSATLNYYHQSLSGGGGTLHDLTGNLSDAGVFVSLFF